MVGVLQTRCHDLSRLRFVGLLGPYVFAWNDKRQDLLTTAARGSFAVHQILGERIVSLCSEQNWSWIQRI